jgi:nucleotide-binding universal stress UspA family protein
MDYNTLRLDVIINWHFQTISSIRNSQNEPGMNIIRNIMVPVGFSEASLDAAKYAAFLAQVHKARLYVLHVKEPFPVHGRIAAGSLENVQMHHIEKEKTRLSRVIPLNLKNSIAIEEIQVTGMPVARVIVETARNLGVDVVVMAPPDRKGWIRFFKKKGITEQIIHDAPCSVFVIRNHQDKDMSSGASHS